MPKFAANLTLLFTELPFLHRFDAAADAGFSAVEFLFPYDYPPEEIAQRLERNRLEVALFNMPPGDWAAGERGMAALPGREAEFARNVDKALIYAQALKVPNLHAMAGLTQGLHAPTCRQVFVRNMRAAADKCAEHGIRVLIEALNTRDVPGYFVAHQLQSAELCEEINRPNVYVQLDLYHAQIMDGDLTRLIEKLQGRFAHVQIASVPERHEPDLGELNYPHLYDVLDRVGYDGHIGCEYNPKAGTKAGLGWFEPYKRG
ncbi:hydroxypyruvate isomerase family protein [Aureimonas fodinaquatilis]|uniref:Hydroxypyruvate isomerase family protein n=1 Tax=Aureimonas fodinaquatilis TaxID=2565783 RepID=A0A5B0E3M1_9HYPH|nr:2-oxo-tetronate isomerase [Aureimonas fodinaquatilis]KAA0972370.1 hydroxypyruvate isomerase family protein [Aureimonas fodinaquatilis]